ncbi:hypothetical protein [Klebsiella quasipneumoniae]|uniref:hypothetical protein n=1 Tax=Klebsiella quasipneumoniae TaxID=1463165 RepID=UPI000E2A81FC|nr:hypothetical protein [Klebsiella quasipneumoniae]SXD25351.1 Uncharacterised protein [Klebsiella quasipneumoniae]
MQIVHLPIVDLPADSPHIAGILKELSCSSVLSVPRTPRGPAGACYWNVDSEVKSSGGKIVLGWLIQWLPGLYVQAMHHAVWETPDGELVDITLDQTDAYKNEVKSGTSTFVPDDRISIDLNWPVLIVNKLHIIMRDHDVVESLHFYSLNCQAAASLFQYLKLKGGSSWTPLGGLKMPPPDEETKLFLQNNTTLTEVTLEMMHKHRANLKAKLFNN